MSNLSDRKARRMAACRTETTRRAVQPANISLFGRYRLLWRPSPAAFLSSSRSSSCSSSPASAAERRGFDTSIPLLSVTAGNSGSGIRRRTFPGDALGRALECRYWLFEAVRESFLQLCIALNLRFSDFSQYANC